MGVACLLASALEFWMCDSEWLAGVIMSKRIRVAEANEKLAKAITRAQSSLVSECQGILDACTILISSPDPPRPRPVGKLAWSRRVWGRVTNRSRSVKLGIFPISCQHWHPIMNL